MDLKVKGVRGTYDVLPQEGYRWRFLQDVMREEAKGYGFQEIRTPVFEYTELFHRSVGETTDVVEKEMYTFQDKGGRSITLKPEGTAGAVRAMLEHGLHNEGLPIKVSYFTPCYRYDKPQAGRWREFYQFGLEIFGSASPAADAELICVAESIFRRLRVRHLILEINSIGCPDCRAHYYHALKEYFKACKHKLCDTCLSRLERNPMRILDCKNPSCLEISKDSPEILDFICKSCNNHFDQVQEYLEGLGISYRINPRIVRGLDYYTRTVFEFISSEIGAQSAVCGGGRYDGLVEEIGGKSMPSLGFAIGVERLLLIMEKQDICLPKPNRCDLYIASMGELARKKAFQLAKEVRESSLIVELDIVDRSLKSQLKYAGKIGAKFSIVLGEEELSRGVGVVKNMSDGEKQKIELGDHFLPEFLSIYSENEQRNF